MEEGRRGTEERKEEGRKDGKEEGRKGREEGRKKGGREPGRSMADLWAAGQTVPGGLGDQRLEMLSEPSYLLPT